MLVSAGKGASWRERGTGCVEGKAQPENTELKEPGTDSRSIYLVCMAFLKVKCQRMTRKPRARTWMVKRLTIF